MTEAQALELFEAADREWRELIDNPVKTVPVRVYKEMLENAMRQRRRTYKAWQARVQVAA
jgi:hypothetical protein